MVVGFSSHSTVLVEINQVDYEIIRMNGLDPASGKAASTAAAIRSASVESASRR
jgi:hypothetical protein